ncbi:MAG: hypothetical protein R3B09_12530 [Nannocystaceae bacterium]
MCNNNVRAPLVVLCGILTATAPGLAAASTPNYGVESRALTGTMPGSGATYSGYLAGETEVDADNDPPAIDWLYNINQQLHADAESHASTTMGELVGHAYALAQRIAATNFPPGVTGTTMGRFIDRLHVVSDTLPNGAPITLTFQEALSIDWEGSSLHDGKASCSLQVGSSSALSSWSVANDVASPAPTTGIVVVKTTVGATLSMSARLDVFARGSFFTPGPRYDGSLTVDAVCRTPLVSISGDARVVAESGTDYESI